MKVIWSIDPFERNLKLRKVGTQIMKHLFSQKDSIECVYVASNNEPMIAMAFDVPKSKRYTEYPKKLLSKQIEKLKIPKIKIKILDQLSSSSTANVKRLASYAQHSKASVIVMPTRGKTGLERIILGSFAESLIHYSQTDLLLYNAKTTVPKKPKKIIYAHDYSKESMYGIQRLSAYANKWQASVVVVHVPKPEYSIRFKEQRADVEKYRKLVKEAAAQVERTIKSFDVPCETVIEDEWKLSEAESIKQNAKKFNADIIAVTAKAGKFAALIGGSVTRSIAKESKVPTLVLKI